MTPDPLYAETPEGVLFIDPRVGDILWAGAVFPAEKRPRFRLAGGRLVLDYCGRTPPSGRSSG